MDLKAMSYMKSFFVIDSDNYYDVEDILIEGENKPPYVIKKGEKIP